MKRIKAFLFTLILILCGFSCSHAYESLWSQSFDGQENSPFSQTNLQGDAITGSSSLKSGFGSPNGQIFNHTDATDTRTEWTLMINSLKLPGAADEASGTLLKLLTGMRLDYTFQEGMTPSSSISISNADGTIFSSSLQKTHPYYISSNFFGEKTYMIKREDRFEEKLTDALYKLINNMSSANNMETNLPDIKEVYHMIHSVREANESRGKEENSLLPSAVSPDLTALQSFSDDLLLSFHETEPSKNLKYLFTDIPQWKKGFPWPDAAALPVLSVSENAITATFFAEDIIRFLNAMELFFESNPEYTAFLNQYIKDGLVRSNPDLAERNDINYLYEFLQSIKGSFSTEQKNIIITLTLEHDSTGSLIRIKSDFGSTDSKEHLIFTYQKSGNLSNSVIEAAFDTSDGQISRPLFRMINVKSSEDTGTDTVNFYLNDNSDISLEYCRKTDFSEEKSGIRSSDSEIRYNFSGEKGSAHILKTETPNNFDSQNTNMEIEYDHNSQGKPLFSVTLSAESKSAEPIMLTDTDAAAAASLSENDYDMLASNIFLQVMMIAMTFM